MFQTRIGNRRLGIRNQRCCTSWGFLLSTLSVSVWNIPSIPFFANPALALLKSPASDLRRGKLVKFEKLILILLLEMLLLEILEIFFPRGWKWILFSPMCPATAFCGWIAGTLLEATYFSLAMKPNQLIDLKADEFALSFPNDPLINSLQINESVNLLIRKCRSYRLCI